MTGFTQAESQAILDARFPTSGATDYIGWSKDGSTEVAGLARTAVGAAGWAAATAAQPSVKANANALTTAAATAAVTSPGVGYFAIFTASTGGTQRTDWTALSQARTLAVGDQLSVAAGQIGITLD